MVKQALDEVCQQLNNNGFYVGFKIRDSFNSCSAEQIHEIQYVVNQKYASICHDPIAIVNPNSIATVLYKVDANVFNAYPIDSVKSFEKFFNSSRFSQLFSGIALVSHKLKMLSFLYACNDVCNKNNDYASLWLYGDYTRMWENWSKIVDDDHVSEGFFPNAIHARYWPMFELSKHDNVYAYEVCLNVEDHYKNDLFYEKISISQDISTLEDSIRSANHIISNMQTKIEMFTSQIEEKHDALKKYEVDLYTSRVESELFA